MLGLFYLPQAMPKATNDVLFGVPRGRCPLAYGIFCKKSPSKYCFSKTVPSGGQQMLFIAIGFLRSTKGFLISRAYCEAYSCWGGKYE